MVKKNELDMMSITVRNIPRELWTKLRIRALGDRVTIEKLVLQWIQQYANGK